jgi:hypothetical protein
VLPLHSPHAVMYDVSLSKRATLPADNVCTIFFSLSNDLTKHVYNILATPNLPSSCTAELHYTGNAEGASVSTHSFRHPTKSLNQSAKPRFVLHHSLVNNTPSFTSRK